MSKLCFSKRARARLFESRALEQLAALAVTVRAEVDAELRRQRSEAGGRAMMRTGQIGIRGRSGSGSFAAFAAGAGSRAGVSVAAG
jgi:hypothetical protein